MVVWCVMFCTQSYCRMCHCLCSPFMVCHVLQALLVGSAMLGVMSLQGVSCSVQTVLVRCVMLCVMSLQDMSCSVHTVFVGRVMKLYPKMTYNKPEVSVMLQSTTTLVIFHFGRCKLYTKNNCMKGKLVNIIMILNYFRRSHPIKSIGFFLQENRYQFLNFKSINHYFLETVEFVKESGAYLVLFVQKVISYWQFKSFIQSEVSISILNIDKIDTAEIFKIKG